jgi:hypothetical protein
MWNGARQAALRCRLLHLASAPLVALLAAAAWLFGWWEAQGALAFATVVFVPLSLGGLIGLLSDLAGCPPPRCCCEDEWGI